MNQENKPQIQKNEIRTVEVGQLEIRAAAGQSEPTEITGYAAVFGDFVEIRDSWGDKYFERIEKGAFAKTLSADGEKVALLGHDWNQPVGSTRSNLTLSEDENGLHYVLKAVTTRSRMLLEDVREGIIRNCSFGFKVTNDDWDYRDGNYFRTIKEVELSEITFTPIPAYAETTAEVRSLNIKKGVAAPNNVDADIEERNNILALANQFLN